ncbi:hypothetical protein ACTHRH_02955 [Paenibacillus sp. SAFN-117]|nr:hypothetical protein [Paenibacillus sp. 32O-W]
MNGETSLEQGLADAAAWREALRYDSMSLTIETGWMTKLGPKCK